MVKKLVVQLINLIFRGVSLLPQKKVVYFESFHGKQYSDNPKAIYLALKAQETDLELVWGVSAGYEKLFTAEKINYVRRFSWRWFLLMPRAQAWVMNTRTPLFLYKNKKITYVQTWHGTPLKKIGLDIPEVNIPGYDNQSYQQEFKRESQRWDLLLAQNKYSSTIFRQAFGYTGEMQENGYPRNDLLVNASHDQALIEKLKQRLGIAPTKKVILYAPTWRESEKLSQGKYEFSSPLDFGKLASEFGSEVVILVRMHYLVSQYFDFSEFKEAVIDVSAYPEMSELLLVSDLLITDYSSSFFDFAILARPMIFYLYDRATYEDELRGLYAQPESILPGPIVTTEAEVITQLRDYLNHDSQVLTQSLLDFQGQFCQAETGQAAAKVAAYLLKVR